MTAAERAPDVLPMVDDAGVPRCSYEDCPSYDGKRCEAMGFRPGSICEPAVLDMIEELRALRREREG